MLVNGHCVKACIGDNGIVPCNPNCESIQKAHPEAKEWIRKMIASGEALDHLSDYNQEARDYWLGKGTRFFKPAPPSGQVTIYRATIGDEIRLGDYVSNSLDYVRYHMETSMLGEREHINILSKVVSMGELMPADGPNEFYLIPPKRKAKANPRTNENVSKF